jgi:hypothetical protein
VTQKLLFIALLTFSYVSHGLEMGKVDQLERDYVDGGYSSGYSSGYSGVTTGGTTTSGLTTGTTSGGSLVGVTGGGFVGIGAPPELNPIDVTPLAGGKCSIRGITSGAWAGSPCEKLYGKTPISVGTTGTTSGGVTGRTTRQLLEDDTIPISGTTTSGTIGTTTGTTTGKTFDGPIDGTTTGKYLQE